MLLTAACIQMPHYIRHRAAVKSAISERTGTVQLYCTAQQQRDLDIGIDFGGVQMRCETARVAEVALASLHFSSSPLVSPSELNTL